MMSRTLSTPVLLAASISITSMSSPRAIPWQDSHLPHGLVVGLSLLSQLSALARMRAIDVLPVPRVPQKRKAWAIRPLSIARLRVLAMWSCPTTSSKVCDRYLRASTVYAMGADYSPRPNGDQPAPRRARAATIGRTSRNRHVWRSDVARRDGLLDVMSGTVPPPRPRLRVRCRAALPPRRPRP